MGVKVSAIVSAYFAEEFLEERLKNLIDQKPRPEIIVICAKDSKEEKITAWYPDVKIIETDGVPTIYEAWNHGVEMARGKYLTNANSDDRLYPGALAYLADHLDHHPETALAYANSDIVQFPGGPPVNRFEMIEGGFDELMQACFVGPMPMWRKELHIKNGLFDADFHTAGDYEFWLRITAAGERITHLPNTIGAYTYREEGAEKREKLRTLWESARARGRYRKEKVPA